jgi:hypothetical protein
VATLGVLAFGLSGLTESDFFVIRFENDLGRPVVLALCRSASSAKCDHPDYRDGLAIGGATEENVTTDLRAEWAVEDRGSHALRCVVLYRKHTPKHVETVRLSEAPRWSWPCKRPTSMSVYRHG